MNSAFIFKAKIWYMERYSLWSFLLLFIRTRNFNNMKVYHDYVDYTNYCAALCVKNLCSHIRDGPYKLVYNYIKLLISLN